MSLLLETVPLVPSWVMGAIVLGILLFSLLWIVGMGSGRPHSK